MPMSLSDFYTPINYPVVKLPEQKSLGDTVMELSKFMTDQQNSQAELAVRKAQLENAKQEHEAKQAELDKEKAAIKAYNESLIADQAQRKEAASALQKQVGTQGKSISDYGLGMMGVPTPTAGPALTEDQFTPPSSTPYVSTQTPEDKVSIMADQLAQNGLFDQSIKADNALVSMTNRKPKPTKPEVKIFENPKTGRITAVRQAEDGTFQMQELDPGEKPVKDNWLNAAGGLFDVSGGPGKERLVPGSAPIKGGGGAGSGASMAEIRMANGNLGKQAALVTSAQRKADKANSDLVALQKNALDPIQVLIQRNINVPDTMTSEQVRAMAESKLKSEAAAAQEEAKNAQDDYEASAAEFQDLYPEAAAILPRRVRGKPAGISDTYAPALGAPAPVVVPDLQLRGPSVMGTPGQMPGQPAPTNKPNKARELLTKMRGS